MFTTSYPSIPEYQAYMAQAHRLRRSGRLFATRR